MYACLAVTWHLHFWQNDRDFLRATVVTRGWNGYRNKSQHRKSTLEKKILPPFQQGFEPATFQSRVRRSNHWAIPAPYSLRDVKSSYLYLRSRLNRNQSRNEELGQIKNNLWERWRKNTRGSQLALEICDTSTTWRMYDVPLVEFVCFVSTHIPAESYSRQFRSLLCLCYIFLSIN